MEKPDTRRLHAEDPALDADLDTDMALETGPEPEATQSKGGAFQASGFEWERLRDKGSLATGTMLIVLGVLFAAAQVLRIPLGHYMWPLFIIVPGLAMFVLALTVGGGAGEPLSAVGGVITMTGLVLGYQNMMNHWQSWAYAWALVGPTAVGLGFAVYGVLKGRKKIVADGLDVAKIGLTLFIIGFIFFELIIGISGYGLGRYGWALGLIGIGVVMLIRSFIGKRNEE